MLAREISLALEPGREARVSSLGIGGYGAAVPEATPPQQRMLYFFPSPSAPNGTAGSVGDFDALVRQFPSDEVGAGPIPAFSRLLPLL